MGKSVESELTELKQLADSRKQAIYQLEAESKVVASSIRTEWELLERAYGIKDMDGLHAAITQTNTELNEQRATMQELIAKLTELMEDV